jgi:DNA-binding NarL/FixJ family response regulator
MAQMTFIIADDHPLFRGAMRQALEGIDANIEILEAGDLESARKKAGDHPEADLILLDLTMPGVSGLSGLIAFRAEFSSLPVVVVSATDDVSTMRRALELGASGFISKSASIDEIREGVRTVLGGGIWTPPDVDLGSEHDQEIASLIARIQTLTPQQGGFWACSPKACSTSRLPMSSASPKPRSRPMCPPFCRSSASTAAPRR